MKWRGKRAVASGVATLATGAAVLAVSGAGSPALAATSTDSGSVSENWAGYVAQGNNFSKVSGSWVVPAVSCTSGSGHSAFWVGLGGASEQSQALEQVGTQSDCTSDGSTDYHAWYELVPAAPVTLDVAVKPGDHITAWVQVKGTNVTVSLSDTTTGQSTTKTLQTDNIDASSAEWIAEAPSLCDGSGACQTVPLANFGTVRFTGASATANGHTGPISDSSWRSGPVTLDGSGGGQVGRFGVAYEQSGGAGAQASTLSSDGSAFSVSYQGTSAQTAAGSGGDSGTGAAPYGDPGYGYGDPGLSGYGDPGLSGYAYTL